MGTYGTDWEIQRYRGDLRARDGWFQDTPTFWRNMKKTATLEANRGYVILLNHSPEFLHGSTTASLYFPSAEGQTFNFSNQTKTTELPYNECTIWQGKPDHEGDVNYDRRAEDSHWFVAGVPVFQNCTITTITPNENLKSVNLKDNTPLYLYEWNYSSGAGSSANYTARSAIGYTFKSTHAYMFQFAGNLTWQTASGITPPAGIVAHRQNVEESPYIEMTLSLIKDNEEADHTYITLAEGATEDYDLGLDLSKIVNSGAQIYSFAGSHLMAANVLPPSAEEVPLGIVFPESGAYTLSISGVPAGKVASIYDNTEGNLLSLDNPVTLYADSAHTSNGRYVLKISKQSGTTTSAEDTRNGGFTLRQADGRLFIGGIEGRADVAVYDLVGHLLYHSTITDGESIPAPERNIYLVRINGETQMMHAF